MYTMVSESEWGWGILSSSWLDHGSLRVRSAVRKLIFSAAMNLITGYPLNVS